jgi:hypothetical protein
MWNRELFFLSSWSKMTIIFWNGLTFPGVTTDDSTVSL